jgi:hypothetical protein
VSGAKGVVMKLKFLLGGAALIVALSTQGFLPKDAFA